MTQGLDKRFLEKVMINLGEAFAYAKQDYDLSLDTFMSYLIVSGYAKEIEEGNPSIVFGQSGYEWVHNVFRLLNINVDIKMPAFDYRRLESFWCGYVLMYYQSQSGYSFSAIQKRISIEDICSMYYPLHESSEDKFVDVMNGIMKGYGVVTKLQAKRKMLGLSQSQLAKRADVNLRTLQEYEIGQKDINKASSETVYRLALALNCEVKDILELH